MNWAYTYDADGNMTEAKATGATTSDTKLTFNAANQIITPGYSYDAAGNLTASPGETYTYNGAEQMTSAATNGVTTTFTYAGASQDQLLTQATTGQATVSYTYGQSAGTGVPEVDTETLGGNTSRVLHDGSTGQALDLTDSDGNTAASLVDGLGNQVGALTDTGGGGFTAFYTPYGMGGVTSNGGSDFWTQNPYGFKDGIRSDAAGLVKFGQRWYRAGIGGRTQEDTLDAPSTQATAIVTPTSATTPSTTPTPQATMRKTSSISVSPRLMLLGSVTQSRKAIARESRKASRDSS